MIWHLAYLREIPESVAWGLTAASVAMFFVFLALVRSGITQSLADPVLGFPHAMVSLLFCTAAYLLLGEHRVNVLVLMAQAIVIAMLRLRPHQVLILGFTATSLLVGGFVWLDWRDAGNSMASKGITHLLVGCSSLLLLSLIAKWVSDLRVDISRQSKDLKKTLLTVQQMATRDQLTGLLNRRALLETLEKERQLSIRQQTNWCVALIDLDHFKKANDDHGHAIGDVVLKGFAEVVSKNLRSVDHVGRWGGEEFLIIFPKTSISEALTCLERLRHAFSDWRSPERPMLKMTLSAGLVQALPDETIDQLVDRADATMYQAKTSGRNRCAWEPVNPPTIAGDFVSPDDLPMSSF